MIIHFISILLQFAAAALALNLAKATDRRVSWILISAAILLMAMRQSLAFYRIFMDDVTRPPDPVVETVALFISILMVAGIAGITPLFLSKKKPRKLVEQSEKQYHALVEQASDGIFIADSKGNYIDVNTAGCEMLGYSRDEILQHNMRDFVSKEDIKITPFQFNEMRAGKTIISERQLICKNGKMLPVEISAKMLPDGRLQGFVRDITERKRVEKTLYRVNRALKMLSDCNQAVVRVTDESSLLKKICQIIVNEGDYSLAWVGYAEQNPNKSVRPVAQDGFEDGYLETLNITWDEMERGQGPTGTAIRTGRIALANDILTNPEFAPWRTEAIKRGYTSSIALPLTDKSRTFGALNIYSAKSDSFDADEIKLLVSLTDDLAYGLIALRTRIERKRVMEELQKRRDENTILEIIAKERGELQEWINTFDTFVGKFDKDGKGIIINDAPIKAGGLTRIDVDNKYFPDTKWWTHSEIEKARITECFEKARAGKASRIETNFRSACGIPVPIIFNCQPVLDDDGKVKYITAEGKVITDEINLRNALKTEKENLEERVKKRTSELMAVNEKLRLEIIERKQMQKALAKSASEWTYAMDFMEDAIYLIDMNDKVIRANRAFYRLTGLTPEQTIGQDIATHIHPSGELVPYPVCKARQDRKDAIVTMEADHPDNPTGKPIEVMVKTILDEKNKPITILMGIHDLTRQRKFEEELRKYQQQLEKRVEERTAELQTANKELKSFAYSVSHDLRAPLRAISGFAQIISQRHRTSLNEEGRHYFDNIVEASTHMGNLIEDLLKYSQIGRKAVEIMPISLRGIFEMIIDTLSERIAESDAQIELPSELPEVLGDRTLLTQIFTNLLDNALLYHKPEKSPQIKINSHFDDDFVIISVKDKGIGIASEYYDKIFNIFQRLHDQDEYPGTGIGLAIVKKSVKLLKGALWVESAPGKGSTFNVKFPLSNEK